MPPGSPPETVFYDEDMKDPTDPNDKGWTTIFIPSKMADNKYLDRNYAGSFGGLPPEMRKALIEGNWDVVPGAAFEILNQRPEDPLSHICRPFKPPRHWTHFMSIDWGTARPFCVYWWTVSEGAELAAKDGWPAKWLPAGAVILYREWYGWNGKENEGCRLDSSRVARKILEIELDQGDPAMDFRVGDSQMWAQSDGPTVAERFNEEGVSLRPSKKDRKMGYAEMRSRLAGSPTYFLDGKSGEAPMLYISSNCQHFWRTIPSLTLDETEPDKGPDTKLEDHCVSCDTLVVSSLGTVRIDSLPLDRNFDVWTTEGWKPAINLGETGCRTTWFLDLDNGQRIEATPNHRFLCGDGKYRRLDELTYDDTITYDAAWPSISKAQRTGFAASTISAKANAFIAKCGSIITALSRRASTSITRTVTGRTTTSPIWSFFPLQPIYATTQPSPIIFGTPNGIWKLECGPRPSSGTSPLPAANGIPSTLGKTEISVLGSHEFAMSAGANSSPNSAKPDGAPTPAMPVLSAVSIRAITPDARKSLVHNLHVPGPNNFIIEGGVVVHNCYDSVVYGLRARPYVTTEHDRWKEEVRAAGYRKAMDPYATA